MKKNYNTPIITLEQFSNENIITSSNTRSAESQAQQLLGSSEGGNVTKINTYKFVF